MVTCNPWFLTHEGKQFGELFMVFRRLRDNKLILAHDLGDGPLSAAGVTPRAIGDRIVNGGNDGLRGFFALLFELLGTGLSGGLQRALLISAARCGSLNIGDIDERNVLEIFVRNEQIGDVINIRHRRTLEVVAGGDRDQSVGDFVTDLGVGAARDRRGL